MCIQVFACASSRLVALVWSEFPANHNHEWETMTLCQYPQMSVKRCNAYLLTDQLKKQTHVDIYTFSSYVYLCLIDTWITSFLAWRQECVHMKHQNMIKGLRKLWAHRPGVAEVTSQRRQFLQWPEGGNAGYGLGSKSIQSHRLPNVWLDCRL